MKTLSAYHQSGSLLNEGHKYINNYEPELQRTYMYMYTHIAWHLCIYKKHEP